MRKKLKKYSIFVLAVILMLNAMLSRQDVRAVHAEGTAASIIKNGDFESSSVMAEAVSATGDPKYGDIGDSGCGWYAVTK